jgi:hypothetical protein
MIEVARPPTIIQTMQLIVKYRKAQMSVGRWPARRNSRMSIGSLTARAQERNRVGATMASTRAPGRLGAFRDANF